MIKIDWRMAPEWADGHGLISWQGFTEVWINAHQYAVVGREGGPYPWGGGIGDTRHNHTRGQVEYITPRPDKWDGEGLPPVGTVCEFAGGTPCPEDPFDKDLREGMQVTIIAHFKSGGFTLAAFTYDPENPDRGTVQVEQGNFGCFRPIRTPEQIAAEERSDEVRKMMALNPDENPNQSLTKWLCEALYDAGYRKQEAS